MYSVVSKYPEPISKEKQPGKPIKTPGKRFRQADMIPVQGLPEMLHSPEEW